MRARPPIIGPVMRPDMPKGESKIRPAPLEIREMLDECPSRARGLGRLSTEAQVTSERLIAVGEAPGGIALQAFQRHITLTPWRVY